MNDAINSVNSVLREKSSSLALAYRLAETACSVGWWMKTDTLSAEEVLKWVEVLEVIESAGLKLVEASNGS